MRDGGCLAFHVEDCNGCRLMSKNHVTETNLLERNGMGTSSLGFSPTFFSKGIFSNRFVGTCGSSYVFFPCQMAGKATGGVHVGLLVAPNGDRMPKRPSSHQCACRRNDTPKWVVLGATGLTQALYNRNVMEADHLDALLIFNSVGLSSGDNIFTKDPCNVLPEEKQLHTQHYL